MSGLLLNCTVLQPGRSWQLVNSDPINCPIEKLKVPVALKGSDDVYNTQNFSIIRYSKNYKTRF
jgi:hypothetical protein